MCDVRIALYPVPAKPRIFDALSSYIHTRAGAKETPTLDLNQSRIPGKESCF